MALTNSKKFYQTEVQDLGKRSLKRRDSVARRNVP